MSFFTWRCDLPQKLQRSCSFESVGRATDLSSGRGYQRGLAGCDGAPSITRQVCASLQAGGTFLAAHRRATGADWPFSVAIDTPTGQSLAIRRAGDRGSSTPCELVLADYSIDERVLLSFLRA